MADGLGADDHVVLVGADLAPLGGHRVLRQATQVDELAVGVDLREGGALVLANSHKFAAVIGGPTP